MQEKEAMLLEVGNILKKSAVEQVCPQKDQFLSNTFTVKKKDGGNRPVINLKELNQYIPFLHFKMESLQSLKTLLQKKRIHVQTRPQGRIFISPTFSGRPKESDVSMGRNSVRVSLPVLWPCTSPICFHKTPKDPHGSFKKYKHTHNNLFGRHVDYWQNKGRDYSSTRYSQSFTSVSGIFYKSEKVSDDTSSGNDSQFKINDYLPSTEKITINETDVSGYLSECRNNSFRVNKGVRSTEINNFGHSPSRTPLSFSPAATNSGTEEKWLLQKSSVAEQRISIGASLVGQKHRNIQWKDLNSTFSPSSFTSRCFAHILGGSLGRNENWGTMDSAGEMDAHKRTGTSCI